MIAKNYDPKVIEPKWAEYWLNKPLFHGDEKGAGEPFSIVIPPPNVTGSLHLGHALNNTLQDILCRYMRMRGKEVTWIPGTDHAGIATQNVVERQLREQKLSKHELGREKFIERVWEWKAKSGGQIIAQLKRLGCSCDWQRERFTMDDGLSHAVREIFVRLYHEGLIYRGDYMINWCPRCESALADLEVEYPEEPESGSLYRFRYPLVDGTDAILIDTTRPETMLGDTAVAVHPDDPRYAKFVGKKVKLPLVDRVIPIIADSFVDKEFGTGAVKITPGHDPNDFEAGRRHSLEIVSVIAPNGKMSFGKYAGMDRFDCRKQIVQDLEKAGALVSVSAHQLKTGRCYRCHTITEPLVSTQWFMKMRELADAAADAVRSGKTRIVPASWQATYFQWLDNIRDWCISRQLWWGHQIPVWYCPCGEMISQVETPTGCQKCGRKQAELRQDSDVLDTWFSSALWPFSTMGWPEETQTLKRFYPTSVLVTGFDILFFWVARMMMMGIKTMGKVPFYDVYLHAMVRDEHGQKMSKTKGNVIDPLEIVNEFGADALRFTLAILAVQGRDVNLSRARIEGYRGFINKLWNASRYTMLMAPESAKADLTINSATDFSDDLASRWIRSRLRRVIDELPKLYDAYDFSEICTVCYRFFWDEFCAWYVEMSKQLTKGEHPEKVYRTLVSVLDVSLRLLHPVIPFVCEEIWEVLPQINGTKRDTLSKSRYPTDTEFAGAMKIDESAEREMELLQGVVTAIRTMRSEHGIEPSKSVQVFVQGDEVPLVMRYRDWIHGLARVSSLTQGGRPEQASVRAVGGLQVAILLERASIDANVEKKKLKSVIQELNAEVSRVRSKLGNEDFLSKAPAAVVSKEQQKLKEFEEKLQVAEESLRALEA